MAARVCSTPGCPTILPRTGEAGSTGRCPACRAKADKGRRAGGNPYTGAGHQRFRETVLAQDPVCVLCLSARSTVADHYPDERAELVAAGENPDDPAFGRGLCKRCHDSYTAKTHGFGGAH